MKIFTPKQYQALRALYEKRFGSSLAITEDGEVDLTRTDKDRSRSVMYISTKDALKDALDRVAELESNHK